MPANSTSPRGQLRYLEFPAGSFDVVLVSFSSLHCLHFQAQWRAALGEVWRVLRPGGSLNIVPPQHSGAVSRLVPTLSGQARLAFTACFQRRRLPFGRLLPRLTVPELLWPHHVCLERPAALP